MVYCRVTERNETFHTYMYLCLYLVSFPHLMGIMVGKASRSVIVVSLMMPWWLCNSYKTIVGIAPRNSSLVKATF